MDPKTLEAEIRREMNRLRGRLAGFIEGCGFPERQERSVISTMKSLSYDTETKVVDLIAQDSVK